MRTHDASTASATRTLEHHGANVKRREIIALLFIVLIALFDKSSRRLPADSISMKSGDRKYELVVPILDKNSISGKNGKQEEDSKRSALNKSPTEFLPPDDSTPANKSVNRKHHDDKDPNLVVPILIASVNTTIRGTVLKIFEQESKEETAACRLEFLVVSPPNATLKVELEQEIIIKIGDDALFQRSEPLNKSSASVVIPVGALFDNGRRHHNQRQIKVALVATFGTSVDLRESQLWSASFARQKLERNVQPVSLVQEHILVLGKGSICRKHKNGELQESNHVHEQQVSIPYCGLISGREPTQGWWNQKTWLPADPSVCRMIRPSFRTSTISSKNAASNLLLDDVKIALFGDSQLRSMFQALISSFCPSWNFHDFTRKKSSKWWCRSPTEGAPVRRPEWNMEICNGVFGVFGDGCWWGGAAWQSTRGPGKVVYTMLNSSADRRYTNWNFVRKTDPLSNETKNDDASEASNEREVYDIIILASELHDACNPSTENNSTSNWNWDPIESPYGKGLLSHLDMIREWHSGPILILGSWATDPKTRRHGYWWAASFTRAQQLSYITDAVIDAIQQRNSSVGKDFNNIWHLDLIRPSMPFRSKSKDGLHLYFPKPLLQMTEILWHNIALLVS